LLGLSFEHRSVSVFRHMDEFRAINPLIKAPTLVCDDGTVVTDSFLIVQHMEDVAGRTLRPGDPTERRRDLGLLGVGIVAADKAVGVEYERKRPEPQRYAPWMDRVVTQLHTALDLLDAAAAEKRLASGPDVRPADIAAAVAWSFCRFVIPDVTEERRWPALVRHTAACEALDVFRAWPIDRE
jgi:glutathione S-transferase